MRYLAHRPAMVLRRRYYVDGTMAWVVGRLPAATRSRLGLEDDGALSHHRIEIGGGPFPRAGYVHVDDDPNARHLEAQAVAWDLPFPDDWADEILSIHTLEHVHPRLLQRTLREWHRVLAPGGAVRVHVPNSPALMHAYLAAK
jgi:SAM-dependent methyltransferase